MTTKVDDRKRQDPFSDFVVIEIMFTATAAALASRLMSRSCQVVSRRSLKGAMEVAALALVVASTLAATEVSAWPGGASKDLTVAAEFRQAERPSSRLANKVSLRAPRTVTAGSRFSLRGHVRPTRKGVRVVLKQRNAGTATWTLEKKLRTNKRGVFSTRAQMNDVSRVYRACVKKKCSKVVAVTSTPPPPPPPVGGSMNYSWTRASDGFSFSVSVSDLFIEDVSYNTIDQELGEAKVYFSINGTGAVTNNTVGRNAYPDFTQVAPVLPMSSAFCQNATVPGALGGRFKRSAMEVSTSEAASGISANLVDTPYCVVASARGSGVDTLAPGATGYQTYNETAFGGAADYYVYVPESVLPAVLAELEQPSFWLLQRGTGSAGVQREYGLGVCHSGIAVVATSAEGASVCAQGVQ